MRSLPDLNSVFFHSWQSLKNEGEIREEFIRNLCKGKRVLHFGFLDSPFSEEKLAKRTLLHQQIKEVADYLYGIDVDAESLEIYRKLTSDSNNAIFDIQKAGLSFDSLANRYDLLLFSEVLEHLLHPAEALANLKEICLLNKSAKVCVTVPNAFSVVGFFTAINGNELVHPDHYYYFSPSTLRKLMQDSGFTRIEMRLYASQGLLDSPGLTKHGVIAIAEP